MPFRSDTVQRLPVRPTANEVGPGIVTVSNWTMAQDGETYLYFFAYRWVIVTDEAMPVEKFRSSERWQMWALDEGGKIVVAVIPGCQVKAWVQTRSCPQRPNIFNFNGVEE